MLKSSLEKSKTETLCFRGSKVGNLWERWQHGGRMKNFILLFLVFSSISSFASSRVELSGELDTSLNLWNLPTGERGNSSTNISSFFLGVGVSLEEENYLFIQFEGSEQSRYGDDRFQVTVRQAYLDLLSVFKGMRALRVGLVPQVWQEAQYQDYNYRFLSQSAWAMTEKWGYLHASDLGISYMTELPQLWGELAFSLTNGEGRQSPEDGPQKEASVFLRMTKLENFVVSLNYVRGSYAAYAAEVGLKERIQALLGYRRISWSMGLEAMFSRDPASAIMDFRMADGVDLLDLTGTSVNGQAFSLYATKSTGEKSEIMARVDYLNVDVGSTGKDLRTAMLAWGYKITNDIQGAINIDYTQYAEEFAPGVRDASRLGLAFQVVF